MRNTIKKILKESKFNLHAHQLLSDANTKTARLHGVDPDDWYLGTQINYTHWWVNGDGPCVFIGSADYEILAEKLLLINPDAWSREDKGYEIYCDIITQYYDLDNFTIQKDNKSVFAFLDRYVNLVFLDDDIDAENFLTDPEEYRHLLGFEYNDWDEDEIGTHRNDMIQQLGAVFNMHVTHLLDDWVDNKIRTDQYRYV